MSDLDIRARVTEQANLLAALEEVRRRDAADGLISPAARRFLADPMKKIEAIGARLVESRFEPAALHHVEIPKRNGGVRHLAIPPFGDRVAERAVARVVTDLIDPTLGTSSFAYRHGISTEDCVARLCEAREAGLRWVLRCDIRDCFDSIPHDRLVDALHAVVPDEWLLELVAKLIARPVRSKGGLQRRRRGTPQGAPLSPLLANLYLEQFDAAMLAAGWPVVRFADDIAIPCQSEPETRRARTAVDASLAELDLEANRDKSSFESFDAGFQFVGVEFGPRFPRASPPELVRSRSRILYVTTQNAWVGLARGHVKVKVKGEEVLSVPRSQVERIVCFGNVNLSSWMRNTALYEGIEVVFLSSRGRYLGRLTGLKDQQAYRRDKQIVATESSPSVASSIVSGKIANMRALLQRRTRLGGEGIATAIDRIELLCRRAATSRRVETLRGLEGTATREYFGALRVLLPAEAGFKGRNRRPPRDAVNAALSFGYSILVGEAVGACVGVGLDPSIGWLHSLQHGRPSLALDLVEEYRPLIVDTVVLELFRRGSLDADSVSISESRGARFDKESRAVLVGALEERMLTVFSHVPSRTRTSYRRSMHLQARQLAAIVDGNLDHYSPVRWR